MSYTQNPGGAPANVVVAAQRLGAQTAFIGKVGEDFLGDFLKETLDKSGVSTEGLISDADYLQHLLLLNWQITENEILRLPENPEQISD